ncbi:putative E3 ubiquitin-protein ligase makorin-1 [Dermatophagoides farinae]|uniref:RING-type E3 ubiquitin transferase n=1 Tax=Dermatophagoides farinae TaxID=6954 RepID=A0A922LA70_DERFA|nr:probable E3 ubiquitin-protein ligase makorin-1 [Dermatophagoides farinae]XP_046914601.1 probable E3 ubiquitin-protein ligase makorin-1 [Dermatophagoides farinae]KAH7636840.1 e3 ubiquitin-protein ligase makorin-1-like protein [Dermatophagoides farinae]KAH9528189.1 E3 ubiquitin-protein ligase makorin-1 [Dermatophagoides farinae]
MFKQLLCRFFQQGACAYGDGCLYSHNPNEAVPIPEDVCIFFLRSNCMYAQGCSRKHCTIEEIVQQRVNSDDTQQAKKDEGQTSNEVTQDATAAEINTNTDSSKDAVVAAINTLTLSSSAVNEAIASTSQNTSLLQNDASTSNRSYASAAQNGFEENDTNRASLPLCTFFQSHGFCVYQNCRSIHGELCDLCGFYSLHPYNKQQSDLHRSECIKEHEESMELSFAYARSKELTCAICLDVVVEKEPRAQRRFGILENCSHVYCIECIRKWRNAQDMDKKNKRNCPQCRVKSDFIIPSQYFYDDQTQKAKLIEDYKKALGSKHCKYFRRGRGNCPFEGACFYKHQYEDGRMAVLPKPSKNRHRIDRVDFLPFIFLDDAFPEFDDDYLSASDIDFLDYDDDDDDDDWQYHL